MFQTWINKPETATISPNHTSDSLLHHNILHP